MRVIAPAEAVGIGRESRALRALNLEMLGLIASSVVVLFGLLLGHSAKVARLDEFAPSAGAIPLHALTGPADLEPALTMFASPFERQEAARALYRRATAVDPRLEHVGGLAAVTVPAAVIRADRRFVQLRARLDRRPAATDVPVLSQTDLFAIKPRLSVRTLGQFNARVGRTVAWFLAAFWLAHLFRRWRRRDDDPAILPAIMLLCGIGLMTMLALRDPLRDTMSVVLFGAGSTAGIIVLLFVSEIDFESSRLRRSVLLPLALALSLATLLLLFGSGPGGSGVKVNLFGVQPVEAIRVLVVFALAAYFGRRLELLRELSEPATPARRWLRYVRVPRWVDVRSVFVSMALVLAFFFLQKDLGPALVLSCVFLALYGIGRGHAAFVLTGFALLLAGFAVAYWIGTPETVRQRVAIWADPWDNGVPGGNHIAHGLWALSTGAAWGAGSGLGSPHSIPAGHTDFVLAAVGEELGFAGLGVIVALYALLCWRCLRIALRAPGDYSAFLAAGVALALVVQALVISSGLLGLVPLSGVVTPFLSFGRSSMLANCFAVGVVLAIARRRSSVREHLRQPIRALGAVLSVAAIALASRAAWVQVVRADDFAAASSLTEQADGGYRFEHNPRLLAAARTLVRGTIYDRNGLPLATSRVDEIDSVHAIYRAAGAGPPAPCDGADARCYPLGGLAFHVIGDWNHQTNWGARNSSYIERESDAQLKGYDDRARLVEVINPRSGSREQAIHRDFRELLPLVRQRHRPKSRAVQALLTRNRDVHTPIDARLQVRAATALRDRIEAGGQAHGAAVVLDAVTGDVLASATYPWPTPRELRQPAGLPPAANEASTRSARVLDRARYGLYPPGSTFKLLVAGAALRAGAETDSFTCTRLPGGRVGNYIRGSSRPVRDDPMDKNPHGSVDLHRGVVVSCNAYFAQLALRLGPRPLLDAASMFQIDVARSATSDGLRPTLPHAGYGQGQVVVSPLKLARISASIATGGVIAPVRWLSGHHDPRAQSPRFLSQGDAARLGRAMRAVVTSGTGRSLATSSIPIAGKTGTAEVGEGAAHSWFTGFAPYGATGRRIAFAVIIENAGYGARAAAPVAGELVAAASELRLIK
jgi:cell division protein FtsW (lipid II flippase)/cell division protein FtsI/penicillin-binding protein 2